MEEPLLDPDQRRRIGIVQAAWLMEDTVKDKHLRKDKDPEKACCKKKSKESEDGHGVTKNGLSDLYPKELRARELHIDCAQATKEYTMALMVMVLLTVFETPAWCETENHFWGFTLPEERCTIPGVDQQEVMLSTLPYLPPGWGIALELVLLFIILRKSLLERKLQINYFDPLRVEYHSKRISDATMAMVILEIVDITIYIIYRPNWRLSFISRTAFLFLLPEVRKLASCISAVLGRLYVIAAFYIGVLIFFAWICSMIFDDVKDMYVFGKPVNDGLDTFRSTFYTMFVAGSTDEFIGCFLPTYTAMRATGLLWFMFLIVVQVLMLNLVLDTLVSAYQEFSEESDSETIEDKVSGIQEVFTILTASTGEAEVSEDTYREFVREFSRSPIMPLINDQSADIIFKAVDKDGTNAMSAHEFFDIGTVIECEFWVTTTDSPVKETFPKLWNGNAFTKLRNSMKSNDEDSSSTFDKIMTYILLVNFCLVLIESVFDVYKVPETPFMENLEIIFSLVYVAEVGLKLCVISWSEYSSSRLNVFDFATTWLLLASSILDEVAAESGLGALKRYVNILRLLRLLRVVKQLRQLETVQFMVNAIATLINASGSILLLLSVVVFGFSTLSIQLWGGILYKSNVALEETEYIEKELYVLNFNDFGTACGVWVVMLLCEYVPDFPEAIDKASKLGMNTWLIFLLFYIVGVCIVFELVKALMIEVFVQLHQRRQKLLKEKRELRKARKEAARSQEALASGEPAGEEPTQKKTSPLVLAAKEFETRGESLHYRESYNELVQEKINIAIENRRAELVEKEEREKARGKNLKSAMRSPSPRGSN